MVIQPDPGAAAERTTLAWQRSGLSLAATGAIVAKGLPGSAAASRPVVGAIVVGLGLALSGVAALYERKRRRAPVRPIATVANVASVALPTAAAGVVLVVLAAWPA